jgi:acyl carrier protein
VKSFDWDSFCKVLAPFLVRLDSRIERQTDLEEAGLESLSLVELLTDIETQFDLEFPVEMLNWETFATAGTLFEETVRLMHDGD